MRLLIVYYDATIETIMAVFVGKNDLIPLWQFTVDSMNHTVYRYTGMVQVAFYWYSTYTGAVLVRYLYWVRSEYRTSTGIYVRTGKVDQRKDEGWWNAMKRDARFEPHTNSW